MADLEPGNEDAKLNRELMARKLFPQIFGYDEFDHSAQILREHEYKKIPRWWSTPTSFGPMPILDQTSSMPAADGLTHVSLTIEFKTSRTLLQNLLPNPRLVFTSVGSVALASFSHIYHSNVGWLGGQSYNELSFYILAINDRERKYNPPSGSHFLAVSFVDSADVLACKREHPGLPMVFCNFSVESSSSHREIKAFWNNRMFLRISFAGMEDEAHEKEQHLPKPALLVHRYVPGIDAGAPPVADSILQVSPSAIAADDTGARRRRNARKTELNISLTVPV